MKLTKQGIKSFTLLEVLIALAILTTAITFIFKAFNSLLLSVKLSKDITFVSFFAENKLWEIEKTVNSKDSGRGFEVCEGKTIDWQYEISPVDNEDFKKVDLNISWPVNKAADNRGVANFTTYLKQNP